MSARQFYIILFVMVVSLKVQKLPSLISNSLEKDTYVVVLAFLLINLILICLAFFILKKTKNFSLENSSNNLFLKTIKTVLQLGVAVYFLSQALLLYESIQNLFSHVLFYELPWTMFSLMLAFAVFYLAYTGIKNISLGVELYAGIIIAAYIVISIFGGTKTDFASVLPFSTLDVKSIFEAVADYNIWFGDFFLILCLGKHTTHAKLKWTALVYTVAMLFVSLLYIEFYGIYKGYTPMKPSLISVLSEQSMLGVNIGRIDWFFILFAEIGTILSAGACLYFSKQSLCSAFPKLKSGKALVILTGVIYFVDIFYLVDIFKQEELFSKVLPIPMLIVKLSSFFILFFVAIFKKKTNGGGEFRGYSKANIEVLKNENAFKVLKLKSPKNVMQNLKNLTPQSGGEKCEK
ncbi:MAG: GerAB/ArcD/ProY family transporter [Clostridia bacterium]|nr:GerAB/ArcD/ProY family transporter [Clostridia bacterium]